MKLIKAFAIGAVLAAGAAFAQDAEPTDPNAIARQELMKKNGMAIGTLAKMAKGEEPYDLAKAEAAKAMLVEDAGMIEAVFKDQGAADPASRSKPEVWTNWDDFLIKAKALGDAAAAVDVSSAETIGAGLGAIGGTCSDCHKSYQIPE